MGWRGYMYTALSLQLRWGDSRASWFGTEYNFCAHCLLSWNCWWLNNLNITCCWVLMDRPNKSFQVSKTYIHPAQLDVVWSCSSIKYLRRETFDDEVWIPCIWSICTDTKHFLTLWKLMNIVRILFNTWWWSRKMKHWNLNCWAQLTEFFSYWETQHF